MPVWLRHVLVAAATLILCSCQAFQMPIEPGDESQVIIDDLAADPIVAQPSAPVESCLEACEECPSGISHPVSDEWLCDGGDFGSPAGVRADWTVDGLEQEDAVAHYDTLDGRILVTPSNRVCIYAPRFAAVRQVVNVMAAERNQYLEEVVEDERLARWRRAQPVATSVQRHAPQIDLADVPPILFRQRQQPGGLEVLRGTLSVYDSLAPYANLLIVRTGQIDGSEIPLAARCIRNAITLTGDQPPQVVIGTKAAQEQVGLRQAGIIYQTDGPDSPWLRLIKLASTGQALPGEEVEFTLRYDNIGDQAIGNVTIVDNLATRFEYVPDSARSTADATFITTPNEGGSTTLRWEIKEPLEPGQGGVLQFRVRVR
jgi:uncharacterized repeat protein (TIGR01451 family)